MDSNDYRKYEPFFGSWYFEEGQAKLGSGSFGSVFRIVRRDAKVQPSALKIISIPKDDSEIRTHRSEGMADAEIARYYQRMVNEIRKEYELMSELKGCSNIVSCEDFMAFRHEDGFGFDIMIRMELLTPLDAYEAENAMDEFTVMKFGIDMCLALERCELKNIIHRDIKPDNIFISDMGDFKLGDFGIARTMEHSNLLMSSRKGTPNYMAPEVYFSQSYDRTADIYSLGIVLYWMLNDHLLPFLSAGATREMREMAFLRRIRGEMFPRPIHGDEALKSIVLKACAYNRQERYQYPGQMRQDLEMVRSILESGGTIPEEFAADLDATVAMTNADLTAEMEGDIFKGGNDSRQEPDPAGNAQERVSGRKKHLFPAGIGAILCLVVLFGIRAFAEMGKMTQPSAENTAMIKTEKTESGKDMHPKEEEKEQRKLLTELSGKELDDLSDLADYKNLESLSLSGYGCRKTEALKGLVKLKTLDLSRNQNLTELSGLSDMKELESLNLSETGITQIEVVKGFPVLRELNISYTNLSDIRPLKQCTGLQVLDVSYNNENLTDKKAMEVISGMKELKELNLTGNMVAGQYAKMLGGLIGLEVLRAGGTGISDGDFLTKLSRLKTLDLQSNLMLEKLEPLEGLSGLEYLNISVTGITSLEGIEQCKNLKELDISMTDISDISMLASLEHLQSVTLTKTPALARQLKKLKKSLKNCRFVVV